MEYTQSVNKITHWLVIALCFSLPLSVALSNVIMVTLILSWFIGGDWSKKIAIATDNHFALAMMAVFGLYLWGGIVAPANLSLVDGLRDSLKLLLPLVMAPCLLDETTRNRALCAFGLSIGISVGAGILKVTFDLPWGLKFGATAVFMNYIKTGCLVLMALFIATYYALKTQSRGWIAAVGILLFYMVGLSASRLGYVLAGFYVLWAILQLKQQSSKVFKWGTIALGTELVVSLLFSPMVRQRVLNLVQEAVHYAPGAGGTSFGDRLDYIRGSWQVMQEAPWLGHGTGQFAEAYARYAEPLRFVLSENPHNQFALYAVEWGSLGLIGFIGILVFMYKSIPERSLEGSLMKGILGMFLMGCLFNAWISDFVEGMGFVVVGALIWSLLPIKNAQLSKSIQFLGHPCKQKTVDSEALLVP